MIEAMAVDGNWDWSLWDQALQFVCKPTLPLDRQVQSELLRWVLSMFQLAIPLVPDHQRAILGDASQLLIERLTLVRWWR